MPDTDEGKAAKKPKSRLDFSKRYRKAKENAPSQKYTSVPLSYYWFKDFIRVLVNHKNFPDAILVAAAIISVSIAFPFYPLVVLVPLLILIIILTVISPLLGLMALMFGTLPMFIYQVPLLAWIFTLFISVSLFLGYKHYRTITFIYALIMLPFSFLGFFIEIPAFIIGVLFIGFKRAAVSAIVIVLLVSMFAGLTGIQNTGPIIYYAPSAAAAVMHSPVMQFLVPSKSATTIATIGSGFGSALATFASFGSTSDIFTGFDLAIVSVAYDLPFLLVQLMVWLLVVFAVSNYVIKSRSAYKGTEATAFGVMIPVAYLLVAYATETPFNMLILLSYIATPMVVFILEINNVNIVRALDVLKQDFIGKFGESFEELTSGARETLDDIADYTETKAELREAILAPIEHREISGAYNVKPARGFLLFGPPGTGKTLMMRALSNEVRARFFYVKSSTLLSPFQGEGPQLLSKIFATVKKHAPAILFFDEIDSIAGSRESPEAGTKQLLSTLLTEMDGFQKTEGVVVVGSTNVPHLLDPSILRPGRFDKIIYMPLPDQNGRAEIFRYYLKKLPVSGDIDFQKLGSLSERYSGADIKNVCDEAARHVADYAVRQKKVLQIRMLDITQVISKTKPSTSLSTIETYNTFRVDYERRTRPEVFSEQREGVKFADVVGLADVKKVLYEAVEIPLLHPNLVKKYDVGAIKGILLFGPPGTGKTMLIRALSNEMGDVNLLTLSGAEISKYGYDKAIVTIKQTFDRARENAPSVIFADEVDSLLPLRDDTTELGLHIVSEFLQQMDGLKELSNVVVVGTTNRPDMMDPALLRPGRFDKLIFTPPPGKDDRAKIFANNLSKSPCERLDYGKLAEMTSYYTGADIANLCRQAKMQALESSVELGKEVPITMDSLLELIKKNKPSSPEDVTKRYLDFTSKYGRT